VHRTAVREFLKRLSAALLLCSVGIVSAQELAPRAYWPAPVGTNVAVLAYQRNTGDIVIDPSLPITGVESEIDYLQVGYQRYFSLFGRTASAQVSLPYADGFTEGFVEGEFRQRTTTGLTDARVRVAINLRGAPAMDVAGFQALRQDPRTIIGASIVVQAPTGERHCWPPDMHSRFLQDLIAPAPRDCLPHQALSGDFSPSVFQCSRKIFPGYFSSCHSPAFSLS
jgi:hypothetical protein